MSSPRKTFERELQLLQDQVLVMGSMVEEAMMTSIEQLKKRDLAGAQRLIEHDVDINAKRYAIEGQTLALIALHQPVARDLRTLAAILEIATELERIGDYAKGIAKKRRWICCAARWMPSYSKTSRRRGQSLPTMMKSITFTNR
jgi:phosphate transport system protein